MEITSTCNDLSKTLPCLIRACLEIENQSLTVTADVHPPQGNPDDTQQHADFRRLDVAIKVLEEFSKLIRYKNKD